VEQAHPLLSERLALSDIVINFPRPGRYNLVILANGDELAQHVLVARLPPAASEGTEGRHP
jgi:hypothetical protein